MSQHHNYGYGANPPQQQKLPAIAPMNPLAQGLQQSGKLHSYPCDQPLHVGDITIWDGHRLMRWAPGIGPAVQAKRQDYDLQTLQPLDIPVAHDPFNMTPSVSDDEMRKRYPILDDLRAINEWQLMHDGSERTCGALEHLVRAALSKHYQFMMQQISALNGGIAAQKDAQGSFNAALAQVQELVQACPSALRPPK